MWRFSRRSSPSPCIPSPCTRFTILRPMEQTSWQRLRYPVLALLALLAFGTVGFRLIMDEPWVSALYRSVVTVSLTGLDTKPDSHGAEVFTILLLIAGVAVFAY